MTEEKENLLSDNNSNQQTDENSNEKPIPPSVRSQKRKIWFIIFLLVLLPLIFRYLARNQILGQAHNVAFAKLLIAIGADVNYLDSAGYRPIFYAAAGGRAEILKLFIEKGADINAVCTQKGKGIESFTALHFAKDEKTATVLLNAGADPNVKSAVGTTPLQLATYKMQNDLVKLLLEKEANPNTADQNGRTPLHEAAFREDIQSAKLLLDKGANANAASLDGNTPLHESVLWNQKSPALLPGNEIALPELLLKHGADPNIKNKAGFTPIDIAVSENKLILVRFFKEKAEKSEPVKIESTNPETKKSEPKK